MANVSVLLLICFGLDFTKQTKWGEITLNTPN